MDKKNKKIEIGLRLKEFRSAIGKTQKVLEADSGVSQSNVARFESGTILPSFDYLSYLHKSHNLNLHWLFNGSGDMLYIDHVDSSTNSTFSPDIARLIEGAEIPLFKYALLERLEELKIQHKEYFTEWQNENQPKQKNAIG